MPISLCKSCVFKANGSGAGSQVLPVFCRRRQHPRKGCICKTSVRATALAWRGNGRRAGWRRALHLAGQGEGRAAGSG